MDFDKEKLRQRIEAGNFVENNGSVLRAINTIHGKYIKIKHIEYARNLERSEVFDSVNYLFESGYIKLRNINSKAATSLADSDYEDVEAVLTAQGIKLIAGKVVDDCIKI